jgi:hypothetical protein
VLQCMKDELKQDYQCHFCRLIFNHQAEEGMDQAACETLVQIHLASNCPVLQQITLILLPPHGRPTHAGPIGHGASSIICPAEPSSAAGQSIPPYKRRRTADQKGQAEAPCRHRRQRPQGNSSRRS